MLVTKVGWAAVGAVNARAREKETKNEDEVNDIHASYRTLPSRARPRLSSFRLFLYFFLSFVVLARSRRYSLSPFSISLTIPHDLLYFLFISGILYRQCIASIFLN